MTSDIYYYGFYNEKRAISSSSFSFSHVSASQFWSALSAIVVAVSSVLTTT